MHNTIEYSKITKIRLSILTSYKRQEHDDAKKDKHNDTKIITTLADGF